MAFGKLAENVLSQGPRNVEAETNLLTGGLKFNGIRMPLLLSGEDSAEAAADNSAKLQAILDAKGSWAVYCDGVAQISSQLVLRDNTDVDFQGVELKARTAIGSLIVTSPYVDAGTTVTVSWTAGTLASVAWPAHGFSAGDQVWLNRADQAQFCGVFRVDSVTDTDNFVVRLLRIPSTTATGTITGRKAIENCYVRNVVLDYNYGTNAGSGNNLHTTVFAGCWNLNVDNLRGKNTAKYLVCSGALARYTFRNIGGQVLNSDVVKVYGPAFSGILENIYAGISGDDFVSFQTREPGAFVAYDFCHGDVIGAHVKGLSGTSNTGAFLLYASPFGITDGVTFDTAAESMGGNVPHCRIETLYTTGTSEIGAVTINSPSSEDQRIIAQLGNGAGTLTLKNLTINAPNLRSLTAAGRLVHVAGTAVTAGVNVHGGYFVNVDNIVNCGTNSGRVTVSMFGSRIGSSFSTFRTGTAGTLDVFLSGVTFENNLGTQTFSAAAGTGILRIAASGTVNVTGGSATYSMGAGSSLRLAGDCDIPLDGAVLDGTVANHSAGSSFYNTNAAFGVGAGKYTRGATTWTRIAA